MGNWKRKNNRRRVVSSAKEEITDAGRTNERVMLWLEEVIATIFHIVVCSRARKSLKRPTTNELFRRNKSLVCLISNFNLISRYFIPSLFSILLLIIKRFVRYLIALVKASLSFEKMRRPSPHVVDLTPRQPRLHGLMLFFLDPRAHSSLVCQISVFLFNHFSSNTSWKTIGPDKI